MIKLLSNVSRRKRDVAVWKRGEAENVFLHSKNTTTAPPQHLATPAALISNALPFTSLPHESTTRTFAGYYSLRRFIQQIWSAPKCNQPTKCTNVIIVSSSFTWHWSSSKFHGKLKAFPGYHYSRLTSVCALPRQNVDHFARPIFVGKLNNNQIN